MAKADVDEQSFFAEKASEHSGWEELQAELSRNHRGVQW